MFAVIGRWATDPGHAERVDARLRDLVLPADRPGFVAGWWSRDPETGRTHTTVVWASEQHARRFKAELDGRRRRTAQLGAVNDYLVVTDVLAHAGPRGDPRCPMSVPPP